jgi:TolA-binding protein
MVRLGDGSSLELAAQTRLRVLRDQPSAVAVEVGDGRVSFDVKHVNGRSFDVRAGLVTVRVVGTRFDVAKTTRREGMEIEVSVKRGIVEVQRADRDGDVRRLTAGETWSVWLGAQPAARSVATVVNSAPAEPAPAPINTVPRVAPATTKTGAAAPRIVVRDNRVTIEGVRALFLRANVARRAGRMQDAANAYAELLKRFPRDSRAGVSAFELGRIRMDALADSKGAAAAFAEAVRFGRRAEFREDALARLAIANEAIGEHEACRKAKARYLADYPAGVHVGSLQELCESPAAPERR